jgi:diguanylate cyclase (GGDEF)-like protein
MTETRRTPRPAETMTTEPAVADDHGLAARDRRRRRPCIADKHALSRSVLAMLDHIDTGILLLDAGMRAAFMNRRCREIWTVPESLMAKRPSFHDLTRHVETTLWRRVAKPERRAYLDQRERAIRAGAVPPTQIELPDGRVIRFRCDAMEDGRRILTYIDITDDVRHGADEAAEKISAELRFATETLENQAAFLVALAEETEETRKRADRARLILEREVEERRGIETQLRYVATTDSLTGVLNRSAFLASAERELRRARRNGKPLSLLMLDADNFKTVNDRHGHAGGDEVLRSLANDCQVAMRSGDSIGRLGGEEFAIVLPGASLEAGEQVAERLRRAIADHGVWYNDSLIFFTISIGVGAARFSDDSVEQIIARADAALYRAKALGRNRVGLEAAA